MIVRLDEIFPNSNCLNLPSLEQIAQGHRAKAKVAINDNPKTFVYKLFQASDYLIEAVEGFEGQILVDLGAGRTLDGYVFSQIAGAKAYVAVEACHTKNLYEKMNNVTELRGANELNEIIRKMNLFVGTIPEYDPKLVQKLKIRMQNHLEEGAGKLPAVIIAEDMLTALKRIPKNSTSILACGIDKCIHPEDHYALEVESEISRTLHPEGVYVGVCSRFEPSRLKNITTVKDDWTFRRYAKK